jgi:hypothetical protein
MEPESSLPQFKCRPLTLWLFHNMIFFYYEELLAPRPTPKLEDHPLLAVRDCLFDIFAATLHIRGLFSIRNLRTRHAVVLGTHLSQPSDGIRSQMTSLPCEDLYRQLMLVGMIFYACLTPHNRATKKCFCQWHSSSKHGVIQACFIDVWKNSRRNLTWRQYADDGKTMEYVRPKTAPSP